MRELSGELSGFDEVVGVVILTITTPTSTNTLLTFRFLCSKPPVGA